MDNTNFLCCDDCYVCSVDVAFEDFYGDGFLISLCNDCAEYRAESL